MADDPNGRDDLQEDPTEALRQDPRRAGELLDRLYRDRLVGFCLGYVGDRELAEDVVQDVFLRVLGSSVVPENFRAWIYKICRNRCLDVQRNRGRRRDDCSLPEPSRLRADRTGALTRLVNEERREHLEAVLQTLPDVQREALVLRYGEGLSRAEIADVLDLDVGLVKSQLFHGLEKLRAHDSLQGG